MDIEISRINAAPGMLIVAKGENKSTSESGLAMVPSQSGVIETTAIRVGKSKLAKQIDDFDDYDHPEPLDTVYVSEKSLREFVDDYYYITESDIIGFRKTDQSI